MELRSQALLIFTPIGNSVREGKRSQKNFDWTGGVYILGNRLEMDRSNRAGNSPFEIWALSWAATFRNLSNISNIFIIYICLLHKINGVKYYA